MSDKPKPSHEAVIKSLETCAYVEPLSGCKECAFNHYGPYDCCDELMSTAAELLRHFCVPVEAEVEGSPFDDGYYKCPECGSKYYSVRIIYNHCPQCGKRLEMPKEE